MKKKLIDLVYLIADPSLCKESELQSFHYRPKDTKGTWLHASTDDLPKLIALHSYLAFVGAIPKTKEELEGCIDSYDRFGGGFLDFDDEENPANAIWEMQKVVRNLIDLGVRPKDLITFLSGSKGCGLYIPSAVIGSAPSPTLSLTYKNMAEALTKGCVTWDDSIYKEKRGQITRTINRKRSNGNFRHLLSAEDFLGSDPDILLARVKTPGSPLIYNPDMKVCDSLHEIYKKALHQPKRRSTKKTEPSLASESVNIKCLKYFEEYNTSAFKKLPNFNDASFLLTSITHGGQGSLRSSEENFATNWISSSRKSKELRMKHIEEQKKVVATKGIKPACNKIRSLLNKIPCAGGPLFFISKNILGNHVVGNPHGTFLIKTDKDGIESRIQIFNGVLLMKNRESIVDQTGRVRETKITMNILVKERVYEASIKGSDLAKRDNIIAAIMAVGAGDLYLTPKYSDLLINFATKISPLNNITVFDSPGWHRNDTFVLPDSIITKGTLQSSTSFLVPEAQNSSLQAFSGTPATDTPNEVFKRWLMAALDLYDTEMFWVVLAHCCYLIVHGRSEDCHRYFLSIVGPSGSGKSTMMMIILAIFGDFFKSNRFVSASSTPNSIEVEGWAHKDLPFYIDDIKGSNISNPRDFKRILQNASDQCGRSRLTSKSDLMQTRFIRGAIVLSGEDSGLYGETSLAGRSLNYSFQPPSHRPTLLEDTKELSRNVRGIISSFIAFIQVKPNNSIQKDLAKAEEQFSPRIGAGENRSRVLSSVATNYNSLVHILEWATSINALSRNEATGIIRKHFEILCTIGRHQLLLTNSLCPAQRYLDLLRDVICSQQAILEPLGFEYDASEYMPSNKMTVGYFSPDSFYIRPSTSLSLVRKLADSLGEPFNFSTKAVSQKLKDRGFLSDHNQGRNTKKVQIANGDLEEFWQISRTSYNLFLKPEAETNKNNTNESRPQPGDLQ